MVAVILLALVALGFWALTISTREYKIRQARFYEPAAQALASYCQAPPELVPSYLNSAWLPEEVLLKVDRLARHCPQAIVLPGLDGLLADRAEVAEGVEEFSARPTLMAMTRSLVHCRWQRSV